MRFADKRSYILFGCPVCNGSLKLDIEDETRNWYDCIMCGRSFKYIDLVHASGPPELKKDPYSIVEPMIIIVGLTLIYIIPGVFSAMS